MSSPAIHIEIAAKPWEKISGLKRRLARAAELTLACLPETLLPAAKGAEATLLLTTDAAVRKLNAAWRGKDKPTNVLSFPQYERRDLVRLGKKGVCDLYVGDIAIAYQTATREAREEGKALPDHVTHLMIHGILHLFGFDHMTPAQAARMEKLERELMATLGLPDPYSEGSTN